MSNSYTKGLLYEFFSIIFLLFKGHKILSWRYKTPVGEIDIISKFKQHIFIHEVKYRANVEDAYHFTSPKYSKRLERTYYWWLNNNAKYSNYEPKFKYIFWHKVFRIKYI